MGVFHTSTKSVLEFFPVFLRRERWQSPQVARLSPTDSAEDPKKQANRQNNVSGPAFCGFRLDVVHRSLIHLYFKSPHSLGFTRLPIADENVLLLVGVTRKQRSGRRRLAMEICCCGWLRRPGSADSGKNSIPTIHWASRRSPLSEPYFHGRPDRRPRTLWHFHLQSCGRHGCVFPNATRRPRLPNRAQL